MHPGFLYRVIARAFRPVAISWYYLRKCCAVGKIVPGDCHVASLLAMTEGIGTRFILFCIIHKQQFFVLLQIKQHRTRFRSVLILFCGQVHTSADHGMGGNLFGKLQIEPHLGGSGFLNGIVFFVFHTGCGDREGTGIGAYHFQFIA